MEKYNYSINQRLHYKYYDVKSIQKNVFKFIENPKTFIDVSKITPEILSDTQKRLNKIISITKHNKQPESRIISELNLQQKALEKAKFLLNQNVCSKKELENIYLNPANINIDSLIPWLEIQLNSNFISDLPLTPCEFIIKYKHLHQAKLNSIYKKKRYSKNLDLLILGLTDNVDKLHPESYEIKKLLYSFNTNLLPELIFFTQLELFNTRQAKEIINSLATNTFVLNLYKNIKYQFNDFNQLYKFISEFMKYQDWLNNIPKPLNTFLNGYFATLYTIHPDPEILTLILDQVKNIYELKLKKESDIVSLKLSIKIKIIKCLLNCCLIHLALQSDKYLQRDFELTFDYILKIAPELFMLNKREKKIAPEFVKGDFYYGLLSIFEFLRQQPSKINNELLTDIFQTIYETGYVDPCNAFSALQQVLNRGINSLKTFLPMLKMFHNMPINYDNLFDCVIYCPEATKTNFLPYILSKRKYMDQEDFDFMYFNLLMTDCFDQEAIIASPKNIELIDWLETRSPKYNIIEKSGEPGELALVLLISIHYLIKNDKDVIKYLERFEYLNPEHILEDIYVSTATIIFKIAYYIEQNTDIPFEKIIKLLINQLELRNSLESLNKIFSVETIRSGLFSIYSKEFIETKPKKYFYQLKDLSYIPETQILSIVYKTLQDCKTYNTGLTKTNDKIKTLIEIYPESEDLITKLFSIQNKNNSQPYLSKRFLKKVFIKDSYLKELLYLEKLDTKTMQISKRIDNLKTYLTDKTNYPSIKVIKRLQSFINEEIYLLINNLIQDYFLQRFNKIFNFTPQSPISDDHKNAVFLFDGLKGNRRLLKKLILESKDNPYHWKINHHLNKEYIKKTRHKSILIDQWINGHRRLYKNVHQNIPYIHLYTENNPLKILHMGNYFNTCLSAGGSFSFSAITNACEINKHVIYATDHNNEIIARQLIALTNDGNILTFEIYNRADFELEIYFIKFVKEFARICNAKLVSEGKVESIITPHWYDDGVINIDLFNMSLNKGKKIKRYSEKTLSF